MVQAFLSRVACLFAVVLFTSQDHNKECLGCKAAQKHFEIETLIDKLPGEYVAVETPGLFALGFRV